MTQKIITLKQKDLVGYLRSTSLMLDNLDEIMKLPEGRARGENIGVWATRLEYNLDAFLHQILNVPLNKLKTIKNPKFKLP